ncbi:MAG: dihydroxyacetone kinase subunit L [Planctomycetia bacterium]|nr:dihydroxyacetone kinase subunit L [Planctomycetia bacterium]
MQTELTKALFAQMLSGALAKIEANFDYLNQLDSATGDGDHGTAILSTMKAAVEASKQEESFSQTLNNIGWGIMSATGGSTSSLNGSFYLGMSEAVSSESLDPAEVSKMFSSGLTNVQGMTQAKKGDKTLMDAMIPAVESMKLTLINKPDVSLNELFQNAATAAEKGAADTENMIAKMGRAKNLGERSRGHRDAGATSFALILSAFAETLSE